MSSQVNHLLQPSSPLAVTSAGAALGVLVVDDDEFIRRLLQRVFEIAGFSVCCAASGREAVEIYQANRDTIDIVLLDVRMPGLDGPATLARLRQVTAEVRCCFMSGDTSDHLREELLGLGGLPFFEKPLNLGELTDALRNLAARTVK